MPDVVDWSFVSSEARAAAVTVGIAHDVWRPSRTAEIVGSDAVELQPITVDRLPCLHRGELVGHRQRRRGCGHCWEAIYTCALHGLAAVHSCGRDVAVCLGCPDGQGVSNVDMVDGDPGK